MLKAVITHRSHSDRELVPSRSAPTVLPLPSSKPHWKSIDQGLRHSSAFDGLWPEPFGRPWQRLCVMGRNRAIDASRPQLFQPLPVKLPVRQMEAIMYALANIDFSDRSGFAVSELTPDEIDRQDQTLDGRQGALADSLSARGLEVAVFGAA